MNAVDTNVLIYARDPRDAVKWQQARELGHNMPDGALLWQVGCEFVAASRKLTPIGYTPKTLTTRFRKQPALRA
jgi:hypothetical protein